MTKNTFDNFTKQSRSIKTLVMKELSYSFFLEVLQHDNNFIKLKTNAKIKENFEVKIEQYMIEYKNYTESLIDQINIHKAQLQNSVDGQILQNAKNYFRDFGVYIGNPDENGHIYTEIDDYRSFSADYVEGKFNEIQNQTVVNAQANLKNFVDKLNIQKQQKQQDCQQLIMDESKKSKICFDKFVENVNKIFIFANDKARSYYEDENISVYDFENFCEKSYTDMLSEVGKLTDSTSEYI